MITTQIIIRFDIIAWDETSLPGVVDGWANGAKMRKALTGDVPGASEGLFISSGVNDGERAYIATERITCTLPDNRTGSFTIQHGGLEADPGSWFGYIVSGTGTGDLEGITGSCKIQHDDQGAFFMLELT